MHVRLNGSFVATGPIETNGTVTFGDLGRGRHSAWLTGVASNCVVAGESPLEVDVSVGATAQLTFTVTCEDDAIEVTAVTAGVDPDPDGYALQLWRLAPPDRIDAGTATLAADGVATLSGLISANYELEVQAVAVNCALVGSNPVAVDLTVEDEAFVEARVECEPVTQLAYVRDIDGDSEIYLTSSNGTGTTALTLDPGHDRDPAWSPDGSKIAFGSHHDGNSEIYVMNADGTNPVRLTNDPAADAYPAWSPDGTKIAFSSQRAGIATSTIHVMNSDGSGVTQLTTGAVDDAKPTWSPDGTKIAFSRVAQCYDYYCERDLFVMNADGSGVTQLTSGDDDHDDPAWSPDGVWIAFNAAPCQYYGCSDYYDWSLKAVRSNATEIRDLGISGYQLAWRP